MRWLVLLVLTAGFTWTPNGEDSRTTITVGGAEVSVTLSPGDASGPPLTTVEAWLDRGTRAVTAFYGHFPQKQVHITITLCPGTGINATTYGGRRIMISLGRETPVEELDHDWTLTHELMHTAFPDLDEDHLWMQEGEATYFEPIARAMIGDYSDERLWGDLFHGLPNGLPEAGDHGLAVTHTWGRTYWGGCLFWFLADLQIRQATGGKGSANDALRGILAAGGNGAEDWKVARVLEVGDQATGTHVLRDLYAKMAHAPYAPDLDALAKELGVKMKGRHVEFDDKAPLAELRKSITAK
jgi:hypothetical protein